MAHKNVITVLCSEIVYYNIQVYFKAVEHFFLYTECSSSGLNIGIMKPAASHSNYYIFNYRRSAYCSFIYSDSEIKRVSFICQIGTICIYPFIIYKSIYH